MYQSNHAYSLIQKLAAVSGKKDKQALLAEFWADDNNVCFRNACLHALDPFITFGISKMPPFQFGTEEFNQNTWDMLGRLQSRELSGKAAKEAVAIELGRLSFESGELLKSILCGKLGAGFTANSVNAVQPGAIFLFKMCLASKFDEECHKITECQWGKGIIGEIKADGVRGVCLESKDFHFVSRNGLPLNSDEPLRNEVKQLLADWSEYWKAHYAVSDTNKLYQRLMDGSMCLDCEMVEANEDFNDSVGSSRSQDEGRAGTLKLKVIDVLAQEELLANSAFDYETRRWMLDKFFDENGHKYPRTELIKQFVFFSEEEARKQFYAVKEAGEEGLIIKLPDGSWEPKRTKKWLKMKGLITVDLAVKSVEAGDPNGALANTLGAVVCDYTNTKGEVVEVRVGGGFSLAQRAEIWAAYTGEDQVYKVTCAGEVTEVQVSAVDCKHWIGALIEVASHEETKYGSLREPRFKRLRTDKDKSEGQGC